MQQAATNDPFMAAFRGSFTSALRWPQLDALWDRLREKPDGWFVYAVGETPPSAAAAPSSKRALRSGSAAMIAASASPRPKRWR